MSSGAAWADPWPFSYDAFEDAPWTLRGSRITAWIELPFALLKRVLSPDLLPPETDFVESRLRFYDLTFEGTSRPGVTAPHTGAFKEAVIAFPAAAHGVIGQVSSYMWTDNDTYLTWGREVFGWPLTRGSITMRTFGPQERSDPELPFASLRSDAGEAAVVVSTLRATDDRGASETPWLTPRRTVRHADFDRHHRELLIVRPSVRDAGRRSVGHGVARLQFSDDHPLSKAPGELAARIVAEQDFVIVVGDNVEVLAAR